MRLTSEREARQRVRHAEEGGAGVFIFVFLIFQTKEKKAFNILCAGAFCARLVIRCAEFRITTTRVTNGVAASTLSLMWINESPPFNVPMQLSL